MSRLAVDLVAERHDGEDDPGGSVSRHEPVMLAEVMQLLAPVPGGTYVDGTIGGAGHALALVERLGPAGTLLGIDRDRAALERARRRLAAWPGTLRLLQADFRDLQAIMGAEGLARPHGILFDLGLSSDQLDDPERGFAYAHPDAPLDMRMDVDAELTAAKLLAGWPEDKLRDILYAYGQERWAARIARFICRQRQREPIRTTGQLVELIKQAVPAGARRRGGHPARRTFQALRIAVNDELSGLEAAVEAAARCLRPGGRMVVLTFHSLEDRPVKRAFARLARACRCPPELPVCRCEGVALVRDLSGGARRPSEQEIGRNRRARSAILRAVERVDENGSFAKRG